MLEALFEKPCWVIDFLPEQVPANSAGQVFDVERFYLQPPRACFCGSLKMHLSKLRNRLSARIHKQKVEEREYALSSRGRKLQRSQRAMRLGHNNKQFAPVT